MLKQVDLFKQISIGLFFCFYCTSTIALSQDARTAFKKISPSIVALANPEGSGTGIVLNKDGYILTNAHVVASPIAYKCKIEFEIGGQKQWKEYDKVQILATHPSLDLAIVKIDPSEQPFKLVPAVISTKKGETGETIYAVGNPGSVGTVLRKTITAGLLSGVDRDFEGEKYYQIDAAINPGNSGGPLVNKFGEVLGVVTFKSNSEENVGFAIPLHNFSPKNFNTIGSKVNTKKASEFAKRASTCFDEAVDIKERARGETFASDFMFAQAVYNYHRAINFDSRNPNLIYNCGIAFRNIDEPKAAEAYMLQSLRINPWFSQSELAYGEFGLLLIKTGRKKEGTIIHREGVAKYPIKAANCWEHLAVTAHIAKDYPESAYYCAVVLHLKNPNTRLKVCNKMFADNLKKMNETQKNTLRDRIRNIQAELDRKLKQAKSTALAKKGHVTKDFGEFLEKAGGQIKPVTVDLSKVAFQTTSVAPKKQTFKERIWTDITGKYKTVATFVSFDGKSVRLKRPNETIVTLPLNKLSVADQQRVKQIGKTKSP